MSTPKATNEQKREFFEFLYTEGLLFYNDHYGDWTCHSDSKDCDLCNARNLCDNITSDDMMTEELSFLFDEYPEVFL